MFVKDATKRRSADMLQIDYPKHLVSHNMSIDAKND